MDERIRSEIGAEAAWRGFSSQTLYIVDRLLNAGNDMELYPENVEDLMIKRNGEIIELVQVKNLSSELTLSKMNPKKKDSFFRRCLKYKGNDDIILRIISFGNVGKELDELLAKHDRRESGIHQKLVSYNYTEEDAAWLLNHLVIDHKNEAELKNEILEYLKSDIILATSYTLVFESLVFHISELSRNKGFTTEGLLEEKKNNIVKSIMAMDSLNRQYQKSIVPLNEYRSHKSEEELLADYRMGVNANPDHIRHGFDIHRKQWLEIIETGFKRNNIVLMKGASGQGKSSLAFRYLMEDYPGANVLCVLAVNSEEQALDIVTVLRGLSDRKNIIVYLDVEPYDSKWLWICEKALEVGLDTKILITIRDEDFQRISIDYAKHQFEIIELELSKEEAQEIYELYPENNYLSFETAWKSFGEKGPLMEYVFMLNHSEKMKQRMMAQVERIIDEEEQADTWLECLSIISLAGIHNNAVSIESLFQKVQCTQQQKMLKYFEKEYFIRLSQNNKYIQSLHVLRARLIYEVLIESGILYNQEKALMTTLGVVEHHATSMIIEYVHQNGITDAFVNGLKDIEFQNIEVYADVIKALLWCEIYVYVKANECVIRGNDKLTNMQLFFLCHPDITGYLETEELTETIMGLLNKKNPNAESIIRDWLGRLPMKVLSYHYVDIFMKSTYNLLNERYPLRINELTAWGYVLFWLSCRGFYVPALPIDNDIVWEENVENVLNYSLGVCKQKRFEVRDVIAKEILSIIWNENGILYDDHDGDEVCVLIDFLADSDEKESNSRLMKVVEIYRRLFPEKSRYNVRLVGVSVLGEIQVPDKEKHIPQSNLPVVWITQLNRYCRNYLEFTELPKNWKNVYDNMVYARSTIVAYFEILFKGVEKLYKKRNSSIFQSDKYKKQRAKVMEVAVGNLFVEPQCAMDRYGIRDNNYIVDPDKNINKYSLERNSEFDKNGMHSLSQKYFGAVEAFIKGCEGFLLESIQHKEESQQSIICYFNLLQALVHYERFQQKSEEFFRRYDLYPVEREREEIQRLVAVFTYIRCFRPRSEASIIYKANEYTKQLERRMEEFLENGITELSGVIQVEKEGEELTIVVEFLQYDHFLKGLYYKVRQLTGKEDCNDYAEYLFQKRCRSIVLKTGHEKQEKMFTVRIMVRNIFIFNKYEKFLLTLLPVSDEQAVKHPMDNFEWVVIQGSGAIENLRRLRLYIDDIEKEFRNRDRRRIVEYMYMEHQRRRKEILGDAIGKLMDAVQFINDKASKVNLKRGCVKTELENSIKQLCEDNIIAKEGEIDEIQRLFYLYVDAAYDACLNPTDMLGEWEI